MSAGKKSSADDKKIVVSFTSDSDDEANTSSSSASSSSSDAAMSSDEEGGSSKKPPPSLTRAKVVPKISGAKPDGKVTAALETNNITKEKVEVQKTQEEENVIFMFSFINYNMSKKKIFDLVLNICYFLSRKDINLPKPQFYSVIKDFSSYSSSLSTE